MQQQRAWCPLHLFFGRVFVRTLTTRFMTKSHFIVRYSLRQPFRKVDCICCNNWYQAESRLEELQKWCGQSGLKWYLSPPRSPPMPLRKMQGGFSFIHAKPWPPPFSQFLGRLSRSFYCSSVQSAVSPIIIDRFCLNKDPIR